jgi:hypothetical protein
MCNFFWVGCVETLIITFKSICTALKKQMEFFDETKLNDDFVSKFENCLKFDGIDVHLIATVVYRLLQTFITHVQKQSLFVGMTSFIEQIESKEWLEQNDLDLPTLQAELRKLADALKQMEYPEFRIMYYEIVDALPFTDRNTSYKYAYTSDFIVKLTYNLIKGDKKVSEHEFIDSLMKTYNRNTKSLDNVVDSVENVVDSVVVTDAADTLTQSLYGVAIGLSTGQLNQEVHAVDSVENVADAVADNVVDM